MADNVELRAAQVVLCDYHYWGGFSGCKRLAAVCKSFRLGLLMHSDNHLGISIGAMKQLAATTPTLIYACHTHYRWQTEDVIVGGNLHFPAWCMEPLQGDGLGVELDREQLGKPRENYKRGVWRVRDDTAEMQKRDPYFLPLRPR